MSFVILSEIFLQFFKQMIKAYNFISGCSKLLGSFFILALQAGSHKIYSVFLLLIKTKTYLWCIMMVASYDVIPLCTEDIMAGNKNTQTEYYSLGSMMNGVSMALFAAITVFFPFVMSIEKYANITKTKKVWFIGIAVVGCLAALCAILLYVSTKPSGTGNYKSRSITLPERKGLPQDILNIFSLLRSVFLWLMTASALITFIGLFTGGRLLLIGSLSLCVSSPLYVLCRVVRVLGTPREEQTIVRTDNALTVFLRSLTLPDIAIILYWICMYISCISSDSPIESIIGLEKRNNGFFVQTLYILVYFIISRGIIFKLWKVQSLIYSGILLSVLSIFHYFGKDFYQTGYDKPRWLVEMYADKNDRVSAGTNFLGPIGNINLLSYIIVICFVAAVLLYIVKAQPDWDKHGLFTLPCCFVMAFAERCTRTDAGIVAIVGAAFFAVIITCNSMERLRRICIAFGISALGWCLNVFVVKHHLQKISVDTVSKALFCGAVILVSAGIIMSLFADRLDKINGKIIRFSAWGAMAFGVVAVCALAIVAARTQKTGTFYEFGQILLGNFDESFGNSRGKIWMKSVQLIDENPLFGIGPDRFATIFSEKLGVLFKGKVLDKAHNEYLDVLICNGIIGLGLFMTFLTGLLMRAVRRADAAPAAGVMAVVIFAYMIHAFFGYQLPIQSPVVWAVLGLAGAACFSADGKKALKGQQK